MRKDQADFKGNQMELPEIKYILKQYLKTIGYKKQQIKQN